MGRGAEEEGNKNTVREQGKSHRVAAAAAAAAVPMCHYFRISAEQQQQQQPHQDVERQVSLLLRPGVEQLRVQRAVLSLLDLEHPRAHFLGGSESLQGLNPYRVDLLSVCFFAFVCSYERECGARGGKGEG